MKDFLKGKIVTIVILLATLVLAGIAIFTAIRLYQLRQVPVAPSAPTSKPAAATNKACTEKVMDIRPTLCESIVFDKTTLKPGEILKITSNSKENSKVFIYRVYNANNLRPAPDNTPTSLCVATGGDITNDTGGECPSGTHALIFQDSDTSTARKSGTKSITYEQLFVNDPLKNNEKVTRIQINAYFKKEADQNSSLPEAACVKQISAEGTTILKACNVACTASTECETGKTCSNGFCRNPDCTSETDCECTVTKKTCNQSCTASTDCETGKTCSSGTCRNPDCTSETDCECATVTATPNSCGGTCGSNSNCNSGLICSSGLCRNALCTTDTDCVCPSLTTTATATATAAPALPDSGFSGPTIFGFGVGAVLIVISLLLAL